VRRAVIVDTRKRRWDALINVPLLPSFDLNELVELLQKARKIRQPDNWPGDLPSYYRVEQYGESGEYLSVQPLVLASDNRFYAIPNSYAIFNISNNTIVEHERFWTPKIIDLLLSTLS
jgi:hypothetical protein